MTELVAETSELVGEMSEAERTDSGDRLGEAVTISKAGVLFGFHIVEIRGFVSKLDTILKTSTDAYTKATGRHKKRLAEPRPSTLWSHMVETPGEW